MLEAKSRYSFSKYNDCTQYFSVILQYVLYVKEEKPIEVFDKKNQSAGFSILKKTIKCFFKLFYSIERENYVLRSYFSFFSRFFNELVRRSEYTLTSLY